MTLKPDGASSEALNAHETSDQVFLVIEGEVEAEIGGMKRKLKTGDTCIIPAGTPHRLANPGTKPALTFSVYTPPFISGTRRAERWPLIHPGLRLTRAGARDAARSTGQVLIGTSGWTYPHWRGTFFRSTWRRTSGCPSMRNASRPSRSTRRFTAHRPGRRCAPGATRAEVVSLCGEGQPLHTHNKKLIDPRGEHAEKRSTRSSRWRKKFAPCSSSFRRAGASTASGWRLS